MLAKIHHKPNLLLQMENPEHQDLEPIHRQVLDQNPLPVESTKMSLASWINLDPPITSLLSQMESQVNQ